MGDSLSYLDNLLVKQKEKQKETGNNRIYLILRKDSILYPRESRLFYNINTQIEIYCYKC